MSWAAFTIWKWMGIAIIVIAMGVIIRRTRKNWRRAALWTLAAAGVGLVTQFILPVTGIFVVWMVHRYRTNSMGSRVLDRTSISLIDTYNQVFTIIGIVLSLYGIGTILKIISRTPKDEPALVSSLPPPPDFGDNNENGTI